MKNVFGVHRVQLILAIGGVAAVTGFASYALTATNTIASGGTAGQGSATISGYTVTNPSYTLLSTDPTKIASFTFTISTVTASTTVKASLVPGTFIGCTVGTITSGSATATCTFAGGSEPLVSAATSLNVSAAN
jgi:hypothetical protein